MDSNPIKSDQNVSLLPIPQGSEVKEIGDQAGLNGETSNNDSEDSAVRMKQAKNKELILEQIAKIPIVEVACKKVGVGRASYYRWIKDDPEFKEKAEQALTEGKKFINDLAESQLIKAIQDGSMSATTYWLNHHHKDYKTKIELTGKLNTGSGDPLTPEQQNSLNEALSYAEVILSNNDPDLLNNANPPVDNTQNEESAEPSSDKSQQVLDSSENHPNTLTQQSNEQQ